MSEADLFRGVAEEDGGMNSVMPGLVPGIHVLKRSRREKAWMAGSSPAMTSFDDRPRCFIRSHTSPLFANPTAHSAKA